MSKLNRALLLIGVLFVVGYVIVTTRQANVSPTQTPQTATAPTSRAAPSAVVANPAGYTIATRDDSSMKAITRALSSYSTSELAALPVNKRIAVNAVIQGSITQGQVEPTLLAIVASEQARDPDVDELTVFLHSEVGNVARQIK